MLRVYCVDPYPSDRLLPSVTINNPNYRRCPDQNYKAANLSTSDILYPFETNDIHTEKCQIINVLIYDFILADFLMLSS